MRAYVLVWLPVSLLACSVNADFGVSAPNPGGTVTPEECPTPDTEAPPLSCALASGDWDVTLTVAEDGCGFGRDPLIFSGVVVCEADSSFTLQLRDANARELLLACTSAVGDFSCALTDGDQALTLEGSSASGSSGGANWTWALGSCATSGTASLQRR